MATRKSPKSETNAIDLLIADHKKVQKLFKEFEDIKEEEDMEDEKADLVEMICMELTVHARLEDEIFYPAAREAIDEMDIMDEADVEHDTAKYLISQLESMEPGDERYDAKVSVLAEIVNHHIKEEQDEMFPKVKKSDVDLEALAETMLQRKDELMEDLASPPSKGGKAKERRMAERRQMMH
jgi:hemerythrin superfamily protein